MEEPECASNHTSVRQSDVTEQGRGRAEQGRSKLALGELALIGGSFVLSQFVDEANHVGDVVGLDPADGIAHRERAYEGRHPRRRPERAATRPEASHDGYSGHPGTYVVSGAPPPGRGKLEARSLGWGGEIVGGPGKPSVEGGQSPCEAQDEHGHPQTVERGLGVAEAGHVDEGVRVPLDRRPPEKRES